MVNFMVNSMKLTFKAFELIYMVEKIKISISVTEMS